MQSMRMLQRQTLRQFLQTRPLRTNLQQLHLHTSSVSRNPKSIVQNHKHSLHINSGIQTLRSRTCVNSLRSARRGYSTAAETSNQHLSVSQRLKKLSREYGWTALGVYLGLSALDFPFCFLAVRLLGTDRIGHWEHVVVSTIKEWIKWPFGQKTQDMIDGAVHEVKETVKTKIPLEELESKEKRLLDEDETYVVIDHGYGEAKAANKGANASIWTQLALAYAIHKSFIFIRVPLTAAVLPKVVKTLRSWGYNIGKMPTKKVAAGAKSTSQNGVNTKGTGVKSD